MSSNGKVDRKISGDIPDLVFKYGENKLVCVEIGLTDNGTNGTKEMNEKRMKTPKMLRSFCGKIMRDYTLASPHNIKLVSFVISGNSPK